MKAIRIDDEQYSRLVYLAKQDDRSVTKYLYKILDKQVGGSTTSPEPLDIKVPSPNISKKIFSEDMPRDKQIVEEIKLLQIDIELADISNQDPDYWQSINDKKAAIQTLWNEWHEVTGR